MENDTKAYHLAVLKRNHDQFCAMGCLWPRKKKGGGEGKLFKIGRLMQHVGKRQQASYKIGYGVRLAFGKKKNPTTTP